jgi:hypothetical protein
VRVTASIFIVHEAEWSGNTLSALHAEGHVSCCHTQHYWHYSHCAHIGISPEAQSSGTTASLL